MTDPVEIWHGPSEQLVHELPEPINCMVADPPYGVNYRSRRPVTPEGKKWVADIAADATLEGAIDLFLDVAPPIIERMGDEGEAYVFTRWDIVGTWIDVLKELEPLGLYYKMMLVWEKGYPGQGDIDCNWGCGHELILYCKKGRREMPYRRSGIISVEKAHTSKHIHPTEKPERLIEILVEMSTDRGDLVVDPFSGSGSTAVACQNTGRRCIGIEQHEPYVAASRERLSQLALI